MGEGFRIIRPTSADEAWSKEKEEIVSMFREKRAIPQGSKVSLLFIAVHLGLSESVPENGAVIHEFASIYSENQENGKDPKRSITLLSRAPFGDRNWQMDFFVLGIDSSMTNVLELKPGDPVAQLKSFTERHITAPGRLDHIISVILFESGTSEVFGDKMDDKMLKSMFLSEQ